jgi:DNA mismatch repair protein MutL
MLLIDQHRAHQRILYERFLSAITSRKGESQHLLFSIFITLNPQQLEQFKETEDILDSLGFQIKLKDHKTLEIFGAPELCPSHKIEDVIESILSESDQISEDQHFSYADQVAKSLAKSLSIKTGDSLLIVEQQVLLDDFFGCKETTISPFNKKIFITLEKSEIEQKLS